MEGPIHIDIFQQNRLLVNGVGLALKLWPSKDGFRLISNEDDVSYKVQILDISFNLCLQKPNAGVLIAHANLIKDSPAIYPYMNSNISVSSFSRIRFSVYVQSHEITIERLEEKPVFLIDSSKTSTLQ
jgi:hypothetical protein